MEKKKPKVQRAGIALVGLKYECFNLIVLNWSFFEEHPQLSLAIYFSSVVWLWHVSFVHLNYGRANLKYMMHLKKYLTTTFRRINLTRRNENEADVAWAGHLPECILFRDNDGVFTLFLVTLSLLLWLSFLFHTIHSILISQDNKEIQIKMLFLENLLAVHSNCWLI